MEAERSARTPRYQGEGAGKPAPHAFIGNTLGPLYLMSTCGGKDLCMLFASLCLHIPTRCVAFHLSPGLHMLDIFGGMT